MIKDEYEKTNATWIKRGDDKDRHWAGRRDVRERRADLSDKGRSAPVHSPIETSTQSSTSYTGDGGGGERGKDRTRSDATRNSKVWRSEAPQLPHLFLVSQKITLIHATQDSKPHEHNITRRTHTR